MTAKFVGMSDLFATLSKMSYLRHYPIEHLWQYLKADLRWASFKTLEELQLKLGQLLSELTPEIIAGITGYPFILDALSVINTI
jgi:putative transposase